MAMPGNSISVIEATDETVSILRKLKRDQPFGNEASSTKNKGMNGGVSFAQEGTLAKATGEFDVRFEYINEDVDDGEGGTTTQPVQYIHVVDSYQVRADGTPYPYAGRVYYGSNNKHVEAVFIKPTQSGYLFLEFDYITGDYEWKLEYPSTLASDNLYTTYRIILAEVKVYSWGVTLDRDPMNDLSYFHHSTVGPITLPLVNQYRGYFRIYYHSVTDEQTGVKTKIINVSNGYFFINGQMRSQAAATDNSWVITNGTKYIYLHYHQEFDDNGNMSRTSTIEILSQSYQSQSPTDTDAYYYLGNVQMSNGLISVTQNSYGTPILFTITTEC